ncbi:GNAT family N-acetyltransferase [Ileibacterium valens]|uniref:GNAT family N-acetyltransferase n=1 Tax=Ileibacterium valens TaxID=1862668 RepID=UPI0023570AD5|nr:GNAT family N-acetyltransferase [Ileibacterium valens]
MMNILQKNNEVFIETDRLILRPWKLEDASNLYELVKDPDIGPACGFLPHENPEKSKHILQTVMIAPNSFAITLKEDHRIIGDISIMSYPEKKRVLEDDRAEFGYWLGKEYWHQGYISEALRALIQYAFENLNLNQLWICYFDGNQNSARVAKRNGFKIIRLEKNVEARRIGKTLNLWHTCLNNSEIKLNNQPE